MGTLAEFLRTEMDHARLSQSEMGRKIGVYPEYIRRWLAGDIPRPEKCAQIAEALGVPISQVMQMAGYPVDSSARVADPEKDAALRAVERIFDERPRSRWPGLITLMEGVAKVTDTEVQRNPEEHHGNEDGRDNVNRRNLVGSLVA